MVWIRKKWAIAAIIAIMALPLLLPTTPPLLDLPSHMASYFVSLHTGDSTPLDRYFGFNWHIIGNLGLDLLVVPFGSLLGVELGTKICVIGTVCLTAAAILMLSRQVHGAVPVTTLLALPLIYNYPLMFGFVNYSLSLAVALATFTLWIAWPSSSKPVLRFVIFAILGAVTWICHAIGWLMLSTMIASYEVWAVLNDERQWTALWKPVAACLPLLSAIPLVFLSPRAVGLQAYGFFDAISAAKWTISIFRDRWIFLDLLSVLFVLVILLLAVMRRVNLSLRAPLVVPAVGLAALFVVSPQSINGSFFVSGRIVPFAVIMALVAVYPKEAGPANRRTLLAITVAFLVLRLGGTTLSFWLYDRDYRTQLTALSQVPFGGSVAALSAVPCRSSFLNWYNPRTYHLPGMAVVRRSAFVNATWSIPGLQLLTVHYPAASGYASDPSEMVYIGNCPGGIQKTLPQALADLPQSAFQRLWLLHIPRELWPRGNGYRQVWSHGDSVMFDITNPKPRVHPRS